MSRDVHVEIEQTVKNNPVVLYMKGNKLMPMCGFSATLVNILNDVGVRFKDVNVLEDHDIREGVKKYADWGTIPQLYVNGEFVGGCDIVREMHANGQLQELVKEHVA